MYITVMIAAAESTARGMIRLASLISSPIVDAPSMPPKANAMLDQNTMSLRPVLGTNAAGDSGMADPYRAHVTSPSAIRSSAGIHAAMPPTLLNHFAMSRPTTFIPTARANPITDTTMKYVLLVESACQLPPPTNRTLAAAKYRMPGKYGRLDAQYVQPVMNPANGPNACLLQT